MANYKLIVAYQGTRYLGWQKTGMGLSIEEELEGVLSRILQQPIHLQAASRTDAGVHAQGQVVNFFADKAPSLRSLNGLLPKDISVSIIEEMPIDFHPTLHATGKEYHYNICFGHAQLPFHRSFSWHFPYALDLSSMQNAAAALIGEHDFSAFTNERQEDNVRHVTAIEIFPLAADRLRISVAGNRFLYKMVRNLVGTIVYAGCGKIAPGDVSDILESKDRTRAGMTAPACGLSLYKVKYDPLS